MVVCLPSSLPSGKHIATGKWTKPTGCGLLPVLLCRLHGRRARINDLLDAGSRCHGRHARQGPSKARQRAASRRPLQEPARCQYPFYGTPEGHTPMFSASRRSRVSNRSALTVRAGWATRSTTAAVGHDPLHLAGTDHRVGAGGSQEGPNRRAVENRATSEGAVTSGGADAALPLPWALPARPRSDAPVS